MELKYCIYVNGEYTRVDKDTYEKFDGEKVIKSGFVWEFPDGREINVGNMFLGLRYM